MPAHNSPFEDFDCQVTIAGARAVIAAHGELDLATVPELEARVMEALAGGAKEVIVDLFGLTFLDSSGLRLMIVCSEAAKRDGFALQIAVAPDSMPWRLFDLAGVLPMLPIVEGSRPQAE
jgi:anti-sigma B factor antagonist